MSKWRITDDDLNSAEHSWVSKLLDDMGDVEPPRELTRRIMAQIAGEQGWFRTSRHTGGGHTMVRKVFWGVAAAAAVLLIAFAVTGFPQVGKGIEGTIGAAKRYQAAQIQNDDVKLQDPELQAFFQTDAFHRLTTDKAAREALTSKEFRQAVADPAVRAALAVPAVQQALASQAVQQALAAQNVLSIQAALASQPAAVQAVFANQAFQAALASPALTQALGSVAFMQALSNAAFVQALSSSQLMQVLAAQSAMQ
jgi:hypothetical protein